MNIVLTYIKNRMKKLFSILMMLMCLGIYAQEKKVDFKLQPTGVFLTENGKNFAVVEFEGKSASDLYSMVKSNAMSLFNDPDKVMSESSGNTISMYAYCKEMCVVSSMGAKGIYSGHYKLVFRFKDGRIRVDAPSIDEELPLNGGFMTGTIGIPSRVFLSDYAKKVCKGNSKKNRVKKEYLEYIVNSPINYLLGFSKSQKQDDDENW